MIRYMFLIIKKEREKNQNTTYAAYGMEFNNLDLKVESYGSWLKVMRA